MKIRKYIMILVLVPLFMGVSYADDNMTSTPKDSNITSMIDSNITDPF